MKNKRLIIILLGIVGILLIPLTAMQFTDEVQWTAFDFIAMGTLLLGAGLTFEFLARRGGTPAYQAAAGLAVFTPLLLIWMNLAVGIIGSEDNPANALYLAVPGVLFLGAFWGGFKPTAMMRTLLAAALVQFLVPIIAFVVWRPEFTPGVLQVLMLNSGFVALLLVSALLFKRAGEQSLIA